MAEARKAKKPKPIGAVTHWYGKIGVAVLNLKGALKVGDRVRVAHGEEEFEETISSMQVDHKPVESVKKGADVAVRFSQKAKEGALLFRAG